MASENNNRLDDILAKAIGCEKREPDFAKWQKEHPQAVQMLKSQATWRTQPLSLLDIGRIIMNSPITKLAMAAVIIITAGLAIYYFAGEGTQKCCAWERIADRIEQAKSCVCSFHISRSDPNTGQPQLEMEVLAYMSSDYGYRIDSYIDGNMVQQSYLAYKEKAMLVTIPPRKKYIRWTVPDEMMSEITKQYQDPRDILSHFMSGEHKELGRSTLDGIEIQGIEATMLGVFKGRMWVDIATEYPVKMEMESKIGASRIAIVIDGFEWNPELSPDIFEPNVPADFESLGEIKMPWLGEATAIDGLRAFAEVMDGKYPSDMDMNEMAQEAQEALRQKMNIAPGVEPNSEEANQISQKMTSVQEISVFYDDLVQRGKDPIYYGKDVTANDANMILMRWKAIHGSFTFFTDFTGSAQSADEFITFKETPSDDYQVIFGDLNTKYVSAKELSELEKQLKK
jgi:outer membrane lipoprotein-sorting protein